MTLSVRTKLLRLVGMPIYEYQCEDCHQVFEVSQRLSDPPVRTHACGSERVKRLISNTSFQLKGGGWYAENYNGQSNAKNTAAPAKDSSSGSTSGSTT